MTTIRDFELKGKKVLIRCDFNVPIKDGIISDDNRIKESLETIEYALNHQAKVILFSHLGRVKNNDDKAKNDLRPIASRLGKLLNKPVIFSEVTRGDLLETLINNLEEGEVLLVQNTRYEDIDGEKESKNDAELGTYWASLGDIFINDAFGTSHRAHASNVGIASHLPSGIGFLVEKELKAFSCVLNNPKRPMVLILGGAKVEDKIGIIEKLVDLCDYILIGGGMAFTFLKSKNIPIGKSLLEEERIEYCQNLLTKYPEKIILPLDFVCGLDINEDTKITKRELYDIKDDEMGLDIGEKTIALYEEYLKEAQTIVWNGPVGCFEIEAFANGTKQLCHILESLDAKVVVGGGDTASAVQRLGNKANYYHISTGGGASLELLEGKELPGIAIIN